jgi:hypothetical protein
VSLEGVVTAEAGRSGSPPIVVVQDATGGIHVHLPDDTARPRRGTVLRVSGPLRDPYGQLEIRPGRDGVVVLGTAAVPGPLGIRGAALGESVEGRLVSVEGVADGGLRRVSGGDLSLTFVTADGSRIRVLADATSRVPQAAVADEAEYRLTGIAGQRASRKGALDGYRIWLRDAKDILRLGGSPTETPPSTGSTRPGSSPRPGASTPTILSIARALRTDGDQIRIQGVVTAGSSLLDTTGRRIVVEDATAAVEVLVAAGATAPRPGTLVVVTGKMARAYGAPRVRATSLAVVRAEGPRAPTPVAGPPGAAHEWRLVRVGGTVADVTKQGSRWRAELETAGGRVPIAGLAGAGIPSATLVEGAQATIVGIVRRPHPSATDRRFAITPRGPGDVSTGPADAPAGSPGVTAAGRSGSREASGRGQAAVPDGGLVDPAGVMDVDLADLAIHAGDRVRVGGIVVELTGDGFSLDDGTAIARIIVAGAATEYLALIEPDDPINVIGRVEDRAGTLVVVVDDPAGIARVGDLPAASIPATASPGATPAQAVLRAATADAMDPLGLGLSGAAGLVTLLVVSLASVAATVLRRRRVREALLARVAARLRTVAARPDDPVAHPPAGAGS